MPRIRLDGGRVFEVPRDADGIVLVLYQTKKVNYIEVTLADGEVLNSTLKDEREVAIWFVENEKEKETPEDLKDEIEKRRL